ncbi:unnamed protein product [Amaranthus hypochondriacus]
MSVKFPNLSWWLWSGKKKDAKLHKRSSIKSSPKLNMMEVDMVKFPAVNGTEKVRRKRRCYEEGKIDKELNVVLVSSDGGCSSDSESDSSDWSIGWSEPHAPGFLSEDEIDGGFGVLVRCYGNFSGSKQDHGKDFPDGNANAPTLYSADSKKYMERWLSSLQGN